MRFKQGTGYPSGFKNTKPGTVIKYVGFNVLFYLAGNYFLCYVKMALMWFPATTESETPFSSSVNVHAWVRAA